jgi:flagellar biogenesis protein FliO
MDGRKRSFRASALVACLLLAAAPLAARAEANAPASIADELTLSAPARAAADAEVKKSQSLAVLTSATSPASPASAASANSAPVPAGPASPDNNLTFTPLPPAKGPAAAAARTPTGDLAVLTDPPPLAPAPSKIQVITPAPAPVPAPAPEAAAPEPLPAAPAPAPLTSLEQKAIRKPSTSQPAAGSSSGAIAASPKVPSGIASVAQVGAALAIVIGLIFVGKAIAKKYVPSVKAAAHKGIIEVLARHPLSKNQSIVLIRIGSQIVALNQGKDQSQSVLVISDQTEVAKLMGQIDGQSPKSIQAGFNRLLANAAVDLEDPANDPDRESPAIDPGSLDDQLEEMAAARRQLMDLRSQVRTVRDKMPRA